MRITAGMVARCRTLAEPRWDPRGERLAFVDSFDGRADLVLCEPAGGGTQRLTAEPGVTPRASYGGGSYAWYPDGSALLFVTPEGHLHRIAAGGGPTTPLFRGPGRVAAPAVAPDGRLAAFMVTTADSQRIAVLDLAGEDWPRRVSGKADFCFDPAWSVTGALAWHEWDIPDMPWDGGRIVLREPGGSTSVVDGGPGVSVSQPRFSPDGTRLAYLSDRTGWLNLWVRDLAGGECRPLVEEAAEHGGPSWGPGQCTFAWSPDGRSIAFARSDRGFGQVILADSATGETRALGPGDGACTALAWSAAGDRLAMLYGSAGVPSGVYTLGIAGESPRPAAIGPPAGFAGALSPPEALSWVSSDGAKAHGLLFRPDGVERPPVLVLAHGGPNSQSGAGHNPRAAYWVDRGWAVLLVNYRGSTGYGRAYTQALRGEWGVHDVEDTAAGVRHLAERGLVDPRRCAVMGGSAGGYTVLLCLARHPELFAAGVDLFGVTDLFRLAEETHRFEAHYLDTIVGPLPDSHERYRERSPVFLADRINTPLLVLQGRDDEVVPLNQSEAIVDRLRARGVDAELRVYDGEGHGWGRVETIADELERIERFLRRTVLRTAR